MPCLGRYRLLQSRKQLALKRLGRENRVWCVDGVHRGPFLTGILGLQRMHIMSAYRTAGAGFSASRDGREIK